MSVLEHLHSEVYVSVDIETDGPLPFRNSMLSFGAAAFLPGKGLVSTFSANLVEFPGAKCDPKTMEEFWQKNPAAWTECRTNVRDPAVVMPEFVKWVEGLPGKPVFVGYPATFDFLFMYPYMLVFAGRSPFSFSALDIKTYAMRALGKPFRQSTKKNMPKSWFPEHPHTHVALDDAIEQGHLFMNILSWEQPSGRIEKLMEALKKVKGLLLAIRMWDMINMGDSDPLADGPWLRRTADEALSEIKKIEPSA